MARCPKCGSENLLRGIRSTQGSPGGFGEFYQPYRCKSCDERFSKFAMDELYKHIIVSQGYWYIGFGVLIIILLIGIKFLFSIQP